MQKISEYLVNVWYKNKRQKYLREAFQLKQAQLGVPHSRKQVELGFILQAGTCQILNFAHNPRQSQSVQGTELNWVGGGTAQKKCIPGWGTDVEKVGEPVN